MDVCYCFPQRPKNGCGLNLAHIWFVTGLYRNILDFYPDMSMGSELIQVEWVAQLVL